MRVIVSIDGGRAVAVGALIALTGLFPPAITYASGRAVAALSEMVAGSVAVGRLVALAAVVAVLFLAEQTLTPVLGLVAERFGRVVDRWSTATVMEAVMRPTRVDALESPAHQDMVLVALGRSDWAAPPGGFVTGAADQWPRRIAACGAVLLVATWNPWVALLLPIVGIIGARAWRRSFYSVIVSPEADLEGVRTASYTLGLAIDGAFARETRIFEMRPWLLARHEALWLRAMRPVWRHRTRSSLQVAAAIAANAVVRLVALGLLARAALRGEVTAATVAVVALSVIRASQLAGISGGDLAMQRCLGAVGATRELQRLAALEPAEPPEAVVPAPMRMIRFEGVHFAYPGGADVLVGLDLEVPVGRSLAIVGFNGAGKTTLAKLLAGLHRPERGRISVDGVDLATLHPAAWQRHIAAIFQDFARYPLTVRENIGWGAPDHLDDDDGIRRAAERAGAMTVIDGLRHGFDTVMDRAFVDGADASGGEWQKIAIARALFAVEHGAGVLILDEPTAQLDARAEADIYERFLELTKGVTTVVISHRFSTIRKADRIVVLEDGVVCEAGSHDELIGVGGRYAELFRVQAEALIGEGE